MAQNNINKICKDNDFKCYESIEDTFIVFENETDAGESQSMEEEPMAKDKYITSCSSGSAMNNGNYNLKHLCLR